MKSNYLFTSMLALTAMAIASCSAPRLAQQNSNDDVYNSVAQAKEYRQQVPVRDTEYNDNDQYEQYDDYGTSDPFYDMDYSSRISRFSYGNPSWRGYYDPYFDSGWYGNYGMSLGFGFGFGYNPFYGSLWGSPYNSWGNYYSPFWGYNNYYGGGYYGGGLWGGGYWGGGFYTGRTTPVDYRPRPNRGGNSYIGRNNGIMTPRASRGQSNVNGTSGRPSRGDAGVIGRPNTEGSRPSRNETSRPPRTEGSRPARTESSRPAPTERPSRPARTESSRPAPAERPSRPESRPTRESYSPPPSYNPPSRGGSSGGSYGGGRPSRGGR
ncbi:hypothetical protein [Pedobacter nyackensis]|uniref:hypothetical protein n=1 Tax=Pedobacter nyackensis TaxID=475255 RepID=UPI00293079E3|nr:hypothetical protein [Pedobacter nyackensis]